MSPICVLVNKISKCTTREWALKPFDVVFDAYVHLTDKTCRIKNSMYLPRKNHAANFLGFPLTSHKKAVSTIQLILPMKS